jgi:REP element-mobilizing transposase RayT
MRLSTVPHAPLRHSSHSFKAGVTRRINTLRNSPGATVWQRNYYEHVVRDEEEFHRTAAYIEDNPRRWAEDEYNPARSA